ncbi:nuclear shuttle protein [Milk vetch chlorotic dwarf virus]|uniref:Putative nuclear shuttle protein n=1 Tax=Milk vetch chlorotic dwarf virus TaxID=2683340 RepID=A0A650FZ07_9VIRU|nr:nuclear shuttle protein [Milk vetch chlorotic dwarf virus]QGV56712.1 nuclear shuttle protein [Milk vetch chlorotic dwarf virus]
MAEWFSSPVKTCTHVCDFPSLSSSSTEQQIRCCDTMKDKLQDSRRVLLVSCSVSFNGSFYGGNRNVRGQLQLSMEEDDGVLRPIGFIPIGGYLYHNDYGYYQGEKTFNLDVESQYLKADEDYNKLFVVNILNENGLDDRCDLKVFVVHTLRIKV